MYKTNACNMQTCPAQHTHAKLHMCPYMLAATRVYGLLVSKELNLTYHNIDL